MSKSSLPMLTHGTKRLMAGWLWLALAALFISLVYALILVLARSGYYAFLSDGERGFKTALVLHVNFSLLVWFMAIAGLLWSWFCSDQLRWLGQSGWWTACLGASILAFSPLLSFGQPVMSDYIPVLQQQAFYAGLGLFALGVLIAACRTLLVKGPDAALSSYPLRLSLRGSALVSLLAAATFLLALFNLPQNLPAEAIPGYLFWGAGHLLQLNHLLLLLFCLLWLGRELNWWQGSPPAYVSPLLLLIVWCALPGPFIQLLTEAGADGHSPLYTRMMEVAGTLGLLLLLILRVGRGGVRPVSNGDRATVLLVRVALLLFVAGSLGGFFISSNNAMVPAHYHGVIGAITLVYMGLAYRLMPLLGYPAPTGRMICWQAGGYGLGILLLMVGLLVSDVPRKALGGEFENLFQLLIGRGLMGLGGGLALLASLLFVGMLFWSLLPSRKRSRGQLFEGVDGGQ